MAKSQKPHHVTFPDPFSPEFRAYQTDLAIANELEDIAPDEDLAHLPPVIYDGFMEDTP